MVRGQVTAVQPDGYPMMNSTISNVGFWAALACAFVTLATIFEYKSDLAKFIREPRIKSISPRVVLVLLMVAATVLMTLAFLVS